MIKLKESIENETCLILQLLDKHFDIYNTKEKAITFKILAIIQHLSDFNEINNLKNMLIKLEMEYYNNTNNCDLLIFQII